MEVGANLIARTARWALSLLDDLRNKTGEPIPLAWDPLHMPRVAAIEVYPAATYRTHEIPLQRYSLPDDREARIAMAMQLGKSIALDGQIEDIVSSPHLLDATACLLAGVDFLERSTWEPRDMELAIKEGWIWFRKSA